MKCSHCLSTLMSCSGRLSSMWWTWRTTFASRLASASASGATSRAWDDGIMRESSGWWRVRQRVGEQTMTVFHVYVARPMMEPLQCQKPE